MSKQTKIKQTPPIIREEFEIVKDDPKPTAKGMVIYQPRAIIEDSEKWGTTIQVTEWVNKTGYEITICTKDGSFQHLSITKEDADTVNRAITKLNEI
jgi:hypothetical protein